MKFSKLTGCFYPDDIYYGDTPSDLIDVTQDDYTAAMNRAPGETLDVIDGILVIVAAPQPTAGEMAAALAAAVDAEITRRLNIYAQARQFASYATAMIALSSKVAKFSTQADEVRKAYDLLWEWADDFQAGVMSGAIPAPTSAAEVIAQIPALD